MRRPRNLNGWKWWARWWACYFPLLAYRRFTACWPEHQGPMYDCVVCLHCGAPWFAGEQGWS